MNLRVDLMLDSERRSPGALSLKLAARVSGMVVPAVIALAIVLSVLSGMKGRAALRNTEDTWRGLKQKKEVAEKLSADLTRTRQVWKAIDGWPASRVNFSEQLAGLFEQVPAEIQLMSLNLGHELKPANGVALGRFYAMTLEGKSVGSNAEKNIQLLVSRLKSAAPFAGRFQTVTIRGWADMSATASRDDRLFAITCVYEPKCFAP
ncbi:MAG: hypothetical protein QME60_06620 [Verrucomicrobiota bacterium]|nr:hypothetical protein [Verrucomicrobiota bacterium]